MHPLFLLQRIDWIAPLLICGSEHFTEPYIACFDKNLDNTTHEKAIKGCKRDEEARELTLRWNKETDNQKNMVYIYLTIFL